MKERPILMSAPMVRAFLAGRKRQTRRKIRVQPCVMDGQLMHHKKGPVWESGLPYICPYGRVGDRLWFKETYWKNDEENIYSYRADGEMPEHMKGTHWKPSIFMRREASRITVEIKRRWVERLQDISDQDAIAEGIEPVAQLGILRACGWKDYSGMTVGFLSPRDSYRTLWESINGPGSWNCNPFVWSIAFDPIECA